MYYSLGCRQYVSCREQAKATSRRPQRPSIYLPTGLEASVRFIIAMPSSTKVFILLIYFLVKGVPNSASIMAVLLSSLHTQGLIASFSVLVP